ncbi:MAG: NERD domain-containing protein [Victivallales bacterium]|nr:NERD domain-containing protein [Victivallales bacterium]
MNMETNLGSLFWHMMWSLFGNWPFVLLCGLALIVTVLRWFRPQIKGWFGETLLHHYLQRHLDQKRYVVLHDIMLPTADETTTQIDHIVVSQWGVFVIETKTYSGWIFGNEKDAQWTVQHFKRKDRFQNPLRQNYKHIATLSECLGISKDYFKTVIAFSGEAEFKTEMPEEVMLFAEVPDYIKSHSEDNMIPPEQVQEVVDTIREWQDSLTSSQRNSHVRNLRKTHAMPKRVQEQLDVSLKDDSATGDKNPRCPRCGAPMVLRKRKADGLPFWGCSQFPKCRCILDIDSIDV